MVHRKAEWVQRRQVISTSFSPLNAHLQLNKYYPEIRDLLNLSSDHINYFVDNQVDHVSALKSRPKKLSQFLTEVSPYCDHRTPICIIWFAEVLYIIPFLVLNWSVMSEIWMNKKPSWKDRNLQFAVSYQAGLLILSYAFLPWYDQRAQKTQDWVTVLALRANPSSRHTPPPTHLRLSYFLPIGQAGRTGSMTCCC